MNIQSFFSMDEIVDLDFDQLKLGWKESSLIVQVEQNE